jgi:hypothetical protein
MYWHVLVYKREYREENVSIYDSVQETEREKCYRDYIRRMDRRVSTSFSRYESA